MQYCQSRNDVFPKLMFPMHYQIFTTSLFLLIFTTEQNFLGSRMLPCIILGDYNNPELHSTVLAHDYPFTRCRSATPTAHSSNDFSSLAQLPDSTALLHDATAYASCICCGTAGSISSKTTRMPPWEPCEKVHRRRYSHAGVVGNRL